MSAQPNPPYRDDESILDSDLIRNLLQVIVSGEQLTIETTEEDETRRRHKDVLRAVQRLSLHLNAVMKEGR